jgi:hypothetical protein
MSDLLCFQIHSGPPARVLERVAYDVVDNLPVSSNVPVSHEVISVVHFSLSLIKHPTDHRDLALSQDASAKIADNAWGQKIRSGSRSIGHWANLPHPRHPSSFVHPRPGLERQKAQLVAPFFCARDSPDDQQILNGCADVKILRDDNDAGAGIRLKELREMSVHGPPIVREQNSPGFAAIRSTSASSMASTPPSRASRMSRALPSAKPNDDSLIKICICLEPRRHAPGSLARWRASLSRE